MVGMFCEQLQLMENIDFINGAGLFVGTIFRLMQVLENDLALIERDV